MRLDVQGVDMRIGQELRERIETKVGKYDKYFDDRALCQVKCTHDGPDLKRVEITLFVDKRVYRAERSEEDIFTALDSAIAVINGQIRKHKTKMAKFSGPYESMQEFIENELQEPELEIDEKTVFRYKEFEIQPMSDEEAALQMELLNHSFFIYLSAETAKVNVIYKRHSGGYGVIEPIY